MEGSGWFACVSGYFDILRGLLVWEGGRMFLCESCVVGVTF